MDVVDPTVDTWHPGAIVAWDDTDRGRVRLASGGEVRVSGFVCTDFTATPHVGQHVELRLRGTRVVSCREARG